MKQAIWIDRFLPPTLNKVMSGHWANGHKLKKECAAMVSAYWAQHGAVAASGKRRVSLHLVLPPKQRRPDRDAFWKAALDALVACGALRDDSPNWCEPGAVAYSRAEDERSWGTLIVVEDC